MLIRPGGSGKGGAPARHQFLEWPVLWALLTVLSFGGGGGGNADAYEWIDHVQDQTSLQVPMEILENSVSDQSGMNSLKLFHRFEAEWFLRKRHVAVGDISAGNALLDRLLEQKIDLGAMRLRPYTASLLRESIRLAKLGEFEQAISLSKAASEFSPGLPEPHRVLAGIYWKQSKFNIYRVGIEWVNVVRGVLGSFDHAVLWAINVNILVLLACLLFFGVFYFVQLIRYYRLLMHDLYEMLPGDPSRLWVGGTVLLGLFVPLIFGWGVIALCLFWALLLWSYSEGRERVVHILFLLFMAVVSLWAGTLQRGMEILHGDHIQSVFRHQEGVSDDAALSQLIRLLARDSENDSLYFMLGTTYKKRGEYANAREAFEKAISINPNAAIYHNNLGNTYYAGRDLARAAQLYEKAIQIDPGRASFYFNLSAAHREQFMLNKSDEDYYKARDLDPDLVAYYVDILGPNYNRLVIDETLSKRWSWDQFRKDLFLSPEAQGQAVSYLGKGSKTWMAPMVFLLLLVPVHYARKLYGVARRCVKCGEVYCKRCQKAVRPDPVCTQCLFVFEERSGLEVKQRTKKIVDIRKYMDQKKEAARFLGILIPGGGHIYLGRILTGFVVLFIVASCLVAGFFWGLLAPEPVVYRATIWTERIWLFVPAALFYGLSVIHLSRLRR